ncbi:hypothetical protein CL617_03440 [archaeon]|nr:hypothetical protein [archaeon]|tara:strand:- start:6558 stop:7088 length:531 start_codon:yes stop_codon:yes gene_type:complete
MKNLFFIVLGIFLLIVSFSVNVSAGEILDVDFTIENPITLELEDGDAIRFISEDREIIVAVDDIGSNGARIKSIGYNNDEGNVFYALINERLFARLDFENDGIQDMEVRYLGNTENKTILEFFRFFPGSVFPDIVGNVQFEAPLDDKDGSFYRNGFIIAGIILVAGLFTLIFLRKK